MSEHGIGISDKDTNLNEGTWYQSACSGLWYRNPKAAGDIKTVIVNGTRYHTAKRAAAALCGKLAEPSAKHMRGIEKAFDDAANLTKDFFVQWRNMVKELQGEIAQRDRQLEKHTVIGGIAPLNECNLEWRREVDALREQLEAKDKELQLTLQQLSIALKGKRPFTFGNEVIEGQAKGIKELEEKCNALANFKTFVHERLDAAGVPKEFY